MCKALTTMTPTLSARYVATSPTATMIASPKPLRKMIPSSATIASVTSTRYGASAWGIRGFFSTCAVASAADNVIVIMKSVAANPSRQSATSAAAR